MRLTHILLLMILAGIISNNCALVYQPRANDTRDKLMKLNVGMLRDEIISILGNPYRREVYGDNEFLFYETNYRAYTERERYTPIFIKSGKLVGFGRKFYDEALKFKIESDIKIQQE